MIKALLFLSDRERNPSWLRYFNSTDRNIESRDLIFLYVDANRRNTAMHPFERINHIYPIEVVKKGLWMLWRKWVYFCRILGNQRAINCSFDRQITVLRFTKTHKYGLCGLNQLRHSFIKICTLFLICLISQRLSRKSSNLL